MKKIIWSITVALLVTGTAVFAGSIQKAADCCTKSSICCSEGSQCCTK